MVIPKQHFIFTKSITIKISPYTMKKIKWIPSEGAESSEELNDGWSDFGFGEDMT